MKLAVDKESASIALGAAVLGSLVLKYCFFNGSKESKLDGYLSTSKLLWHGWLSHRKNKEKLDKRMQLLYKLGQPLEDVNIVVTGASSGLGRGIAAHLLTLGATLILPLRRDIPEFKQDLYTFAKTIYTGETSDLLSFEEASTRIVIVNMDLSDFASIRSAVDVIKSQFGEKSISALVNNAGLVNPSGKVNSDGIEMTLAVNGLGTILFTELLMKSLTLKQSQNKGYIPRIVSVTSGEHRHSPMWNLNVSLVDQPVFQNLSTSSTLTRYSASKFIQTTYFLDLQGKLKVNGSDIVVLDICPGGVSSKIASKFDGWLGVIGKIATSIMNLGMFGFLSPEEASKPIINFLTHKKPLSIGGEHYMRSTPMKAREDAFYPQNKKYLERQVKKLVSS